MGLQMCQNGLGSGVVALGHFSLLSPSRSHQSRLSLRLFHVSKKQKPEKLGSTGVLVK